MEVATSWEASTKMSDNVGYMKSDDIAASMLTQLQYSALLMMVAMPLRSGLKALAERDPGSQGAQ